MRYLKVLAAVGFAAGLGVNAHSAVAVPTIGVGGASGALYDNDYHLGYGVTGSLGSATMDGMGEVAIKGNWLNYQGDEASNDLNEGGAALTALVGPGGMLFQPKIGAHVGYQRFESDNFLDVGPDISATYKMTPQVGINAAVTPTWLFNEDGNDYRTRASLGVQWFPGAG